MITDYLGELLAELQVSGARRRRIVAEAEDHLQSTAAELHASGLDAQAAEREAVRRFGPARELAQTFHEDAAALTGRSVGRSAVVLSALLVLIETDPPGIVTWARAGFPAGLLAFVFGQIALVAGALTAIRLYRARETRGPRAIRLTLILRGALVVLICGAVTFGCGVALLLESNASAPLRSTVSVAVLGVAVVTLAVVLRRGRDLADAARLDRAAVPSAQDDAVSDLVAIGGARLHALMRRLPRVLMSLDLRRHPWRLASAFALAAGLALGVAHAFTEGGPPSLERIPLAVLAGGLIAAVEASAVVLSFGVLGHYLGIRGRLSEDGPSPTP